MAKPILSFAILSTSALLLSACNAAWDGQSLSSPAATTGTAAGLIPALYQAQLEVTSHDQIVTDDQGNEAVLTAVDGQLHPLLPPLQIPIVLPPPDSYTAENPNPAATPCSSRVITTTSGPDSVMLDELGYVTPVVDQGGRGTCDNFGAMEALESAYLVEYYKMTSDQFTARYGHPLLLSEQYMISIKDYNSPAFHDTGSGTSNLQKLAPYCGGAPALGVPLAAQWPYVPSDSTVEEVMMKAVPGAPVDTADFVAMMAPTGATVAANGLPGELNADLADYNWSNLPPAAGAPTGPFAATFPAQSVHEQAFWAPTQVVPVSLPQARNLLPCGNQPLSSYAPVTGSSTPAGGASYDCYEALAAPLEQVLSEHHAMTIGVNYDIFKLNSSLGAYVYDNPNGLNPQNETHDILLIGYDRKSQLFKIKNSWGSQWGINGFAYVTYDLMLRTLGNVSYVGQVYDPDTGAIPNLVWRGLWRGQIGGKAGVAAIHRLLMDNPNTTTTASGGIFYGDDGSQTPINFLSWDLATEGWTSSYTANFGDANGKPLFSLTLTKGSQDTIASYVGSNGKSGDNWSKCNPGGLAGDYIYPETYGQAGSYPYVLPPCLGTAQPQPWHVAPTWECPKHATYSDRIEYLPEGATSSSNRNGCLVTSDTAPKCPSQAFRLVEDQGQTQGFTPNNVAPGQPQWLDVCTDSIALTPTPPLGCDPNESDTSKGGCYRPTCAAPTGVFGLKGATLRLGSTEPGVWAIPGADQCVTEAVAATASCPAGYVVSPNGNDCVLVAK